MKMWLFCLISLALATSSGYAGCTSPVITAPPQSLTVCAGQSATFTVAVTGTTPLSYQWRKGGIPLSNGGNTSGSTTPNLTIAPVSSSDNGSQYTVVVTNRCGSVLSSVATLTVIIDTNPPTLVSAAADCASNTVCITFSEPVDPVSATAPANYSINNGVMVLSVVLGSPNTVCLNSTPLNPGVSYTVSVNGVRDLCGNIIAANSQIAVACLASYTVTISNCCSLIANQLDSTLPGGNTLPNIMPTLPCNSRFMKYDNASGTWITTTYTTATGWADGSITLNPGEGAFLCPCCSNGFTLTFTGLPHPAGTNFVSPFGLVSRLTNDIGTYENITQSAPADGARIYQWNCNGYVVYTYYAGLGWVDSSSNPVPEPTAAVGEALWVFPFGGGPPPDAPQVSCPCVPPPPGLAAWWTFDEMAGPTANDLAGMVNNLGTYNGSPTPSAGMVSNALCFNGINDFVQVANQDEINFIGSCTNGTNTAESFTIDAWIKVNPGNSTAQTLLDKRSNIAATPQGYNLFLDNGALSFQLADGVNWYDYISPGPDLRDGQWHFIAVTVARCGTNGNAGTLYVGTNQVLNFLDPLTGDLNNSADLLIGQPDPYYNHSYYSGCLDELEIFKRVLAPQELQGILNAGSAGKCKDPCLLSGPTLLCSNLTITCGSPIPTDPPACIDPCCSNVLVTLLGSTTTSNSGCSQTIYQTWQALDPCYGTSNNCVRVVTVGFSPPTLLCSNLTIACGSPIPTNPPAWIDVCCSNVVVSLLFSTTNNGGCGQTIDQTWLATELCCGTSNFCVRTVTVLPSMPTLLCSNVTISCGTPIPTDPPAWTDPCCSNVYVSLIGSTTTSSGCSQTITQTWQALDQCCNTSSTCDRVVTVSPSVPTFLCSNLTITCGSPIPTDPPAWTDPCCGSVLVSLISSTTTNSGCTQTIYQTWQALDQCCGTSNTCVRVISVLPSAPTLLCSNLTITCGTPIPTNPPAWNDACCSNVVVSLIGSSTTTNGCNQTNYQTWQALDPCCGTSNMCVRVVTVTYLPPPQSWTPAAPMPTALGDAAAALLPSGRVLVAGGGVLTGQQYLTAAQIFDPALNGWASGVPTLPQAHRYTAVRLLNGRVLVAGDDLPPNSFTAYLYDENSPNTWLSAGHPNSQHISATLTLLASGNVLLAGGYCGGGCATYNTAEIYNPNNPLPTAWTSISPMANTRHNHTATVLLSGKVLVAGGAQRSPVVVRNECELFTEGPSPWSAAARMIQPRIAHTATLLPNGQVLVVGGSTGASATDASAFGPPTATAEIYDPISDTWAQAASMSTPRFLHTATLLACGKVLITGGQNDSGTVSLCEIYDYVRNSWSATTSMSVARARHTATLLESGQVFVTGGWDAAGGGIAQSEIYTPGCCCGSTDKAVACGTVWSFDVPLLADACCGFNTSPVVFSTLTNGPCPQVITRTWLFTNTCGYSNFCSQAVTVVNTNTPVITCVSNKTVSCTSAWSFDLPSAYDSCTGSNLTLSILSTVTSNATPCRQVSTRTWGVTNACGYGNATALILSVDFNTNSSPTESGPPVFSSFNIVGTPAAQAVSFPTDPLLTSGNTTISLSSSAGNLDSRDRGTPLDSGSFTFGELYRDFATTFDSNRTLQIQIAGLKPYMRYSFTFYAFDAGTAVLSDTFVNTTTVPQPSTSGVIIQTSPTISFNGQFALRMDAISDGSGIVTFSETPAATTSPRLNGLQIGVTGFTCSQTVTVVDTTPPLIICASGKTVNSGSAWDFDPPTATDACCGTNVTIVVQGTVTNLSPCQSTYTRTWTATDCCSNSITCSQTVTVSCCIQMPCVGFDNNAEGWYVVDRDPSTQMYAGLHAPPVYRGAGGNPGGFLQSSDGFGDWYWRAPSTYYGNKSGFCGAKLSFDLITDGKDVLVPNSPQGVIIGNTITELYYDFSPMDVINTWKHFEVPLCSANWKVLFDPVAQRGDPATPAQFQGILATLTTLDILGEFGNGPDTGGLDNVCIACCTNPVSILCPTNKTIPCTSSLVFDLPTVINGCCGTNYSITTYGSDVNGGTVCAPTVTRTWLYVGCCGHSNFCGQTVTLTNVPMVITSYPSGSNLGCNPTNLPTDSSIRALVTMTGGCGLTTNVTHVDGGTGCASNRTFTITVSNACGSAVASNVVYTWTMDTTPPILVCASNKTVQCWSGWTFDPPSASDNCCTNLTYTLLSSNGTPVSSCVTLYAGVWQVTDCCSNSSVCTQLVTELKTPPSVVTPGILLDYSSVTNSRIVFAGGGFTFVGPTTNVQFQIDDVVGGFGDSIGFYGYFSSTSPYTIGTITTNGSIQTAPVAGSGILHISDDTQEYTGTIQWLDITTLGTSGVLNLNGQVNLTVIGYPGASLNLLALAASLTAQVDLTFQFIPARTLTDLKATGGFTDFSGTILGSPVVTTPPLITCATNKTVACGTAWTFDPPTSASACCTNLTIIPMLTQTNGTGCGQVISQVWKAFDCCSNSVICTQVVTVLPSVPVLLCSNLTIPCGSPIPTNPPAWIDLCCSNVTVTLIGSTVISNGCGQTIYRTWQALDHCCGASTVCTQTVTVGSTQPPVLTCAGDKTVQSGTPWNFDPPGVSGPCCSNVTLIAFAPQTNGNCCTQLISQVWQATCCTNSATCTQTVTVICATPPLMTSPANKTVACGTSWEFDLPQVAAACCPSNTLVPVVLNTVVTNVAPCTNVYTRTWQVTDGCGHTATSTQSVTAAAPPPGAVTIGIYVDATGTHITFPTATCYQYTVVYTDVLVPASWITLGVVVVGDGLSHEVLDPGALHHARFYRVRAACGGQGYIAGCGTGMAPVPAGSFLMGDTFAEGDIGERPTHTINVSAFCMDTNLVSYALWTNIYQWATSHGYSFDNAGSRKAANHPVQTVNWYDMVKWCNARSEMEGLTPCYYTDASQATPYRSGSIDLGSSYVKWTANGYRLPTEAEWEKAARGGAAGHRFPWTVVDTIDWSRANYYTSPGTLSYDVNGPGGNNPAFIIGGLPYTSPLGSFAPNGYGLYDMAGNLSEWCWDWYDAAYYSSSPGTDPLGPASGFGRVSRGGAWALNASGARCASRYGNAPANGNYDFGFRCVRGH